VEEEYVDSHWIKMIEDVDRQTQKLRRDLISHLWEEKNIHSVNDFEKFYENEIKKLAWVKENNNHDLE